jgi:hypothetical protein
VDQVLEFGPQKVFSVVAGVLAFTCLLTIPMYIYGKKYVPHFLLICLNLTVHFRVRALVHKYIKFSEEDETTIVGH